MVSGGDVSVSDPKIAMKKKEDVNDAMRMVDAYTPDGHTHIAPLSINQLQFPTEYIR